MTHLRTLLLLLPLLLLVAPALAQPATRPGRDGGRDRRDDLRRRPPPVVVDDAAWAGTKAFLREHSPHRLALIERFEAIAAERGWDGARLRGRVHGQVARVESLADDDPELHGIALDQFRAEDRAIGAILALRRARAAGDDEAAAEAEARVSQAVAEYVERSLDERRAQIDRLARRLDDERDRLARDERRRDELADRMRRRFERILPGGGPSTRPSE